MIWLVAIAMAIILVWTFTSSRRAATVGHLRETSAAQAPARDIRVLNHFEGSDCIFEEGAQVLKVRVIQIEPDETEVRFNLQVLRAEGLTVCPDEMINLSASWHTLAHSETLLHAHYVNWKLFADRELVCDISARARDGESIKAIQRTLLEYRMKNL
jgi:hypothetical protein